MDRDPSSEVQRGLTHLRSGIAEFMARNGGRLYAPIDHPDFSDLPAWYDAERFDLIERWLHPSFRTALDIGTNLGAFAHWLESRGLQVVAIEREPFNALLATEIRDYCGRAFDIQTVSLGDLGEINVDLVLALNVFHHSLKTKAGVEELRSSLPRISCKACILQCHETDEAQMQGAYMNWGPEELAANVASLLGHPFQVHIGTVSRRKIFLSSIDVLTPVDG